MDLQQRKPKQGPEPRDTARRHRTLIIGMMIIFMALPILLGLARLFGKF